MVLGAAFNRAKYFGDHSSLHGVRYVLSTKKALWVQRFIWLLIICFSAYGMLYILSEGTELFEEDAISFVPETTHLNWETDFPAVTVCEAFDSDKLADYYDENKIPIKLTSFYKEVIFLDSQHFCRSCTICKKVKCPENLAEIASSYKSPCNETLVRCSWRGETFNCCDHFLPIITEYGECFVFNSALVNEKRMYLSNKLTGPGYLNFSVMEAMMIDIHSPDDVIYSNFDKPIINGKEGILPFASEFVLKFKVEETNNEQAVRNMPINIRKCLFPNENRYRDKQLYSRYSYSTCTTQCRALKQLEICNCTHYMLPRMDNESSCDVDGLLCLTQMIEQSSEEDIDLECGCLPSCEEPNYTTIYLRNSPNSGELTDELIERGTIVSIRMELLPSTRVKRLVVRSPLDYVVFVGGTAGIFFGASILSLLEIFYLMFIRKY